ncbi:hypothetical protein M9Y10_027501 [Tritrichomonas musculus]|uniref:Calpastatin n=1 Tax=Tritrichomonas musculus TaxID=1915356 RepID=A0ABR2H537_9EUKA
MLSRKGEKDLTRFLKEHDTGYQRALREIKNGKKRSHWMWYIFPQIQGLGRSEMNQYYSIKDLNEAKEYMANEILRNHLIEISQALLQLESNDPREIFGYPDYLKLQSSMTLFGIADPEQTVFKQVLDKFYNGEPDAKTIGKLKKKKRTSLEI